MKKVLFFLLTITVLACNNSVFSQINSSKETTTFVSISTKYGEIVIKLYNETPLHRDNFIKLANEKYFDSTLFHRVIKGFMIQGGDPSSKNAQPGIALGNGGPAYTIPAEFHDTIIHKKGALAAARQSDNVNPKKESSGSQFYLVQGRKYTDYELTAIETQINNKTKQQIFNTMLSLPQNKTLLDKLNRLQQEGKSDSIQIVVQSVQPEIEKEFSKTIPYKFSKTQREVYSTIGGTPMLDGSYTVFGEVISGLDVIDKIADQPTLTAEKGNRPLEDIKMVVKIIKK